MWVQKVPGGGVQLLAYAPDGGTLYAFDGGSWVTAWDVVARSGNRVFNTLPDRPGWCRRLEVAGGGRYLLAFGQHAGMNHLVPRPGVWLAWDLRTGAEVSRLPSSGLDYGTRVDPAGTTIVRIGPGSVRHWDFVTGRDGAEVGRWHVPGPVGFAELSGDDRVLAAAARGDVYLADLTGRETAYRLDLPGQIYPPGGQFVFAPDGNTLVVADQVTLHLWDIAGRRVRAKVRTYGSLIAFHPTAPVFAALNSKKVLTLFDLDTGEPIRSLDFALGRYVQCVAFAPDGMTCAVGGSNKQFAVFDVDL